MSDFTSTSDKTYLDLAEVKIKLNSFEYHGEFTIGWEDLETKIGNNCDGVMGAMKLTESEFQKLMYASSLTLSNDGYQSTSSL